MDEGGDTETKPRLERQLAIQSTTGVPAVPAGPPPRLPVLPPLVRSAPFVWRDNTPGSFSAGRAVRRVYTGRGLHSSTFRLNVSSLCGIRGAFRGCLGGVYGVLWGIRGYQGASRVCFVSETAQVELKRGRV